MEKSVSVNLVVVVTPIVAQPGDHLMLLGDICIGVDKSGVLSAPQSPKTPAAKKPKAKSAKLVVEQPPPATISRDQILGAFQGREERLTCREVGERLGVPSSRVYYHLSQMVGERTLMARKLKDRGIVYQQVRLSGRATEAAEAQA